MKKLLVTGISGFLGSYFSEINQNEWKIIGVYHNTPIHHPNIQTLKIDLSREENIRKLFASILPDAVLHLAASSNPNWCETNEVFSKKINQRIPILFAKLCHEKSIPYLFTSTDLVFDGTNAPYKETDQPNPISIYGRHKAAAEKGILEVYPEAIIARCPVMFGLPKWGDSFMSGWIRNLQEGKTVFAFTDEYRTKISGQTAVAGMLHLLRENVKGIFHLGGREQISRYDFALLMAEVFELPMELIKSSVRADVKMPAARPENVSLTSDKAYQIGFDPPCIKDELISIKAINNSHDTGGKTTQG